MSSGQSPPDPVQPSQIIQQRIVAMEAQNSTANAQLADSLQQMRDNLDLAGQWSPPGQPVPVDDLVFQRAATTNSQWASEVIFAATLDAEFKEKTGQQAREILIGKGILPAAPLAGAANGAATD